MTLAEVVVSFAIAGVLLGAAAPNLKETVQNNQMVTRINNLHAALSLARAEAVKRRNNITVCNSNDGASCTGDWQEGWIVFVDSDSDGKVESEEVVRVYDGLSADHGLSFSATSITYAPKGYAKSGTNATFVLCDSRGAAYAQALVIGPSGRPGLAKDSDESGVLNDAEGNDLVCGTGDETGDQTDPGDVKDPIEIDDPIIITTPTF